jgi:hypothetical protein
MDSHSTCLVHVVHGAAGDRSRHVPLSGQVRLPGEDIFCVTNMKGQVTTL